MIKALKPDEIEMFKKCYPKAWRNFYGYANAYLHDAAINRKYEELPGALQTGIWLEYWHTNCETCEKAFVFTWRLRYQMEVFLSYQEAMIKQLKKMSS